LRAKECGFELIGREHQWRHVEVAVKDITLTRLATDWHFLPDQIGDIAVNGPLQISSASASMLAVTGRRERRRAWIM